MMTVNEVSKRTGVSIRTLQYYDKIGLLHPAHRTQAGYRLYDDAALERLQQILLFRELEFSLEDIRKILKNPEFDREKTEEEMSALSDRLMQVTKGMTITVRYFKEDTAHPEIPAVGNYITLTGKADRIDPVFRTLQVGETVVPFEDLVEISGESIMEIDQYLGITED